MTTMNDLFDRYERECIPDLQPRTRRDYLGILQTLRATFGTREPESIKPRHIVEFLQVPKGRVHRNRMVTILSTVYKKAIYRWCLSDDLRNPCDKVERWPTKPRTRYVTDAEFAAVKAIACERMQIAMDLAYLTSQRQGDIVSMEWDQIKAFGLPRDQWYIDLRQGKTGKHLGIKISPQLEAVLLRAKLLKPYWPRKYVLRINPRSGVNAGDRFSPDGFRALWQRTMNAYVKNGGTRYSFHDLRAKAVSDNQNLQAASALAGHIDMKITARVYKRNIQMVEPLR